MLDEIGFLACILSMTLTLYDDVQAGKVTSCSCPRALYSCVQWSGQALEGTSYSRRSRRRAKSGGPGPSLFANCFARPFPEGSKETEPVLQKEVGNRVCKGFFKGAWVRLGQIFEIALVSFYGSVVAVE